MTLHSPLQQLRDIDKTSPLFHEQLSNFFRRSVYQNVLPNLQNESLAWLVEYLDSVRLKTTLLYRMLNIGVGSLRGF